MKKSKQSALGAFTILLVALSAAAQMAGPGTFDLTWHSIDCGGGKVTGGTFSISGTIGQPEAGTMMTGGSFTLAGGYWPAGVPCPADITGDGVVSINDLLAIIGTWGNCPGCQCPADVTGDCLVNINDLLVIISAWGPCR